MRWARFLAGTNNVIVLDLNRNLKESIQVPAGAMKKGRSIIIFSEGTRTSDGSLGTFKETFAILGRELNVPIVPVAIAGPFEALPTGRAIPRPFRPVEVTFRPPVHPGAQSCTSLAAMLGDTTQVRKFYEEKG